MARKRLLNLQDERESLKVMIRSDAMLTADTGCNYACAILKYCLHRWVCPTLRWKGVARILASHTFFCLKRSTVLENIPILLSMRMTSELDIFLWQKSCCAKLNIWYSVFVKNVKHTRPILSTKKRCSFQF